MATRSNQPTLPHSYGKSTETGKEHCLPETGLCSILLPAYPPPGSCSPAPHTSSPSPFRVPSSGSLPLMLLSLPFPFYHQPPPARWRSQLESRAFPQTQGNILGRAILKRGGGKEGREGNRGGMSTEVALCSGWKQFRLIPVGCLNRLSLARRDSRILPGCHFLPPFFHSRWNLPPALELCNFALQQVLNWWLQELADHLYLYIMLQS